MSDNKIVYNVLNKQQFVGYDVRTNISYKLAVDGTDEEKQIVNYMKNIYEKLLSCGNL